VRVAYSADLPPDDGASRVVTRTAQSWTDHEQIECQLPGALLATGIGPIADIQRPIDHCRMMALQPITCGA
jgi:hypothetical protein